MATRNDDEKVREEMASSIGHKKWRQEVAIKMTMRNGDEKL